MTGLLEAVCLAGALALAYLARRVVTLHLTVRQMEAAQGLAITSSQADTERLEAQMTALCQEYDALMQHCAAGVLVLDGAGVIERANEAARELLGIPTQTLVGKSLLQATLSNELNGLARQTRESLTTQQRELRGPGASGSALVVSVSPIAGRPPHQRLLLVAYDVTELRRLETIRRDFVANVSHELRTPLASIRAMAETLQDGALDDPSVSTHFLNTIVNEAQRLTRISEDLLILSQAESRQPEKDSMTLSDLAVEVVARFQTQAEKAGVRLDANVPRGLKVFANHDQVEQVLVNLVDNAIKYTPAGGKVCLTAAREDADIAVHVTDTGIGIMEQDLPRIFERFYRVDKARSRRSGGTGLGLAIVKHIVEIHGGVVTVESEYNRGSTFTFTLPALV